MVSQKVSGMTQATNQNNEKYINPSEKNEVFKCGNVTLKVHDHRVSNYYIVSINPMTYISNPT